MEILERFLINSNSHKYPGVMPELYADENVDWETYYRSYVDAYLQRDIRDLAQVADEMQFYNFMTIVAAQTSKPVVYEELASAAGISAPTAKKWLSILVSSHIIALVQPYHNNALKRVVKMPLLHFLDTGLAAYLLKWGNPEALERGAMSGAFFESYVFSEIYKSYLNAGKEPPVFYYRDKDKKELQSIGTRYQGISFRRLRVFEGRDWNRKRGLYGKRSAACRRKELVCTSLADLIRIL